MINAYAVQLIPIPLEKARDPRKKLIINIKKKKNTLNQTFTINQRKKLATNPHPGQKNPQTTSHKKKKKLTLKNS